MRTIAACKGLRLCGGQVKGLQERLLLGVFKQRLGLFYVVVKFDRGGVGAVGSFLNLLLWNLDGRLLRHLSSRLLRLKRRSPELTAEIGRQHLLGLSRDLGVFETREGGRI